MNLKKYCHFWIFWFGSILIPIVRVSLTQTYWKKQSVTFHTYQEQESKRYIFCVCLHEHRVMLLVLSPFSHTLMAAKATGFDIYLRGGGTSRHDTLFFWLSRDQKKIKWKIDTSFPETCHCNTQLTRFWPGLLIEQFCVTLSNQILLVLLNLLNHWLLFIYCFLFVQYICFILCVLYSWEMCPVPRHMTYCD